MCISKTLWWCHDKPHTTDHILWFRGRRNPYLKSICHQKTRHGKPLHIRTPAGQSQSRPAWPIFCFIEIKNIPNVWEIRAYLYQYVKLNHPISIPNYFANRNRNCLSLSLHNKYTTKPWTYIIEHTCSTIYVHGSVVFLWWYQLWADMGDSFICILHDCSTQARVMKAMK